LRLEKAFKLKKDTVEIRRDYIILAALTADPALEPGMVWCREDEKAL